VIFRKRHRKRTPFIFPVEPFDLSLKDVFLIVGDMLNLALGSLSSAKLLEFNQKIPTAKAAVGMIKSDCTSWRCPANLYRPKLLLPSAKPRRSVADGFIRTCQYAQRRL